jgi:glycosyltransferase involved in cell wall biosynthesis
MKKILFLYTEMAGYMLACIKKLGAERNVEVHVIVYPVNPIAPFKFSLDGKNLHFHQKKDYSAEGLSELCRTIQPDIIICSGWIDKDYLEICRQFKDRIKTIMILDNPWRNTLRQNLMSVLGPVWLKKYFTHCWAAGLPQLKYALKLGFNKDCIKEGIYSCDYEYFHQQYELNRESKSKSFPKRIIYVGRYTKLKGVKEMWEAFRIFQDQQPSDWELWCFGKGEYESIFPVHSKIKNFGFVQPGEMSRYISETGVFILPSHYEHWGVVVHEFASAGFPLICSTTTSAAVKFLEEDRNGYFHEPCSIPALVTVFTKLLHTPQQKLIEMGDQSSILAKKITPDTWCDTAIDFLMN